MDSKSCKDLIVFDSNRSGTSEIYATNGRSVWQLTRAATTREFSRVPDISPDGSRIAFQSRHPGDIQPQIYTMSCDGTSVLRVTDGNEPAASPAWSPDGRLIAYVRGESTLSAIQVISEDGRESRPVQTIPTPSFYPAWSPDGRALAFVTKVGGAWEIHVADLESGEVQQLTHSPAGSTGCGGPAWSPDGSLIAFDATWAGNFDIYVMRSDGSSVGQLTFDSAVDARPAWSPDGKRIAFHSTRDRRSGAAIDTLEGFELYVMNADGTNVKRLTRNEYFDGHPDW